LFTDREVHKPLDVTCEHVLKSESLKLEKLERYIAAVLFLGSLIRQEITPSKISNNNTQNTGINVLNTSSSNNIYPYVAVFFSYCEIDFSLP
jgi:hypothetical protein